MPDSDSPQVPSPPSLPGSSIKGTSDAVQDTGDPRQGLPASVRVEEATTPIALDTTKRTSTNGQYIQYNGVGTMRQMGPAEWKEANVDSDDYFEWNYLNHKRIPREAFSDEQLQYLLRVDDRFELVEIKEDTEAKADK